MGEDGNEVLAISLYWDELFVRAAVVGGVIGAKENGLRTCYGRVLDGGKKVRLYQILDLWGGGWGVEDIINNCYGLFGLVSAGNMLAQILQSRAPL